MTRYSSKIGDIYCVKLDESTKKYFQYIANDMTQLNSSVIRVFKNPYAIDEIPDLNELIKGEVDFYVHVVINWGVKLKFWEKVGNVKEIGALDILFRSCGDFGKKPGETSVQISHNWRVWNL